MEVVRAAIAAKGTTQKAPFTQEGIDLSDKAAVTEADRKRFAFVNQLVAEVETRKVRTSKRNSQDKIDMVLTNKWLGIPIFAVVMFAVFDISQSTFGPFLADTLVGWIEGFQGWIAGLVKGASPFYTHFS